MCFSYGDAVRELDWGVGELMLTLNSLNLSSNTLVLFSSDNGASLFSGPVQGKTILQSLSAAGVVCPIAKSELWVLLCKQSCFSFPIDTVTQYEILTRVSVRY